MNGSGCVGGRRLRLPVRRVSRVPGGRCGDDLLAPGQSRSSSPVAGRAGRWASRTTPWPGRRRRRTSTGLQPCRRVAPSWAAPPRRRAAPRGRGAPAWEGRAWPSPGRQAASRRRTDVRSSDKKFSRRQTPLSGDRSVGCNTTAAPTSTRGSQLGDCFALLSLALLALLVSSSPAGSALSPGAYRQPKSVPFGGHQHTKLSPVQSQVETKPCGTPLDATCHSDSPGLFEAKRSLAYQSRTPAHFFAPLPRLLQSYTPLRC